MSDIGDLIAVGLLAERNGLGLTATEAHAIGERIAPHLNQNALLAPMQTLHALVLNDDEWIALREWLGPDDDGWLKRLRALRP